MPYVKFVIDDFPGDKRRKRDHLKACLELWRNQYGPTCAADVEAEIRKLWKETKK